MKNMFSAMAASHLLSLCILFSLPNSSLCFENPDDGKRKPVVITVDGMSYGSTLLPGWPDMPTIYLYEAVTEEMREKFLHEKNGRLVSFSWSRDTEDTWRASEKLRDMINFYYEKGYSVRIMAHSWGSVIAYVAIVKNPDLKVDKLITMGSPLSSVNITILPYVRLRLAAMGILSVEKPDNLKIWHNFSMMGDTISGKIESLPKYSSFFNKNCSDSLPICHRRYFKNEKGTPWKTILNDAMGFNVSVYDPVEKKSIVLSGPDMSL